MKDSFPIYILVMAGVTYLIRMIPLVLFKKEINNRFILSFLYYVPYAVLAVMTFPAVFYATSSVASAVVGVIVAIVLAYFEKSLTVIAFSSCFGVFITEFVMKYLLKM